MSAEHPITPPPELVQQWAVYKTGHESPVQLWYNVANQAARWGADIELEACVEWLLLNGWGQAINNLRAARRPKPPSLAEEAMEAQQRAWNGSSTHADWELIRAALQRLQELEKGDE